MIYEHFLSEALGKTAFNVAQVVFVILAHLWHL